MGQWMGAMMKNWIRRLLGLEQLETRIHATEKELEKKTEEVKSLEQQLKEHQQPTEKDLATTAKEPYVSIVRVEVDPTQPGNGSFELDWNEYFVQKLVRGGYKGKTDEQIVDQWFQDVCRHVVLETYEQYEANNLRVSKRDLGDGRSEIS
jgi:hypothetical protein